MFLRSGLILFQIVNSFKVNLYVPVSRPSPLFCFHSFYFVLEEKFLINRNNAIYFIEILRIYI